MGGQEVLVNRYAIPLSYGPLPLYKDGGTSDLISVIARPLVGDLYRRPHPTVLILQGEH